MKFRKFPIKTKLELGQTVYIKRSYNRIDEFKFIQTTRKGFNFLSMSTHKCLSRNHFYDTRYSNKKLPNQSYYIVGVPVDIHQQIYHYTKKDHLK
jgi:hypothetical protein